MIVIPRSDVTGFQFMDVQQELPALLDVVQQPDVKHLVIDFSSADYFGSTVISIVNELRQAIAKKGGRTAVCNASEDMEAALRIMKLDRLWTMSPTREDALRAVTAN